MNAQEIFAVFYAIFWGAVFSVSSRWKQFNFGLIFDKEVKHVTKNISYNIYYDINDDNFFRWSYFDAFCADFLIILFAYGLLIVMFLLYPVVFILLLLITILVFLICESLFWRSFFNRYSIELRVVLLLIIFAVIYIYPMLVEIVYKFRLTT